MHDKDDIVISKVHYEFTFLLEFILISKLIPIKIYCTMNNLKIDNINVEYGATCFFLNENLGLTYFANLCFNAQSSSPSHK
jgi:hypothetical protein